MTKSEHTVKTIIVVPNWNGIDWLGECLDSLCAQTEQNFSLTVVDNGSTDGSRELVEREYPEVKLIARDKNYGFTGGTNPGMRDAIERGAQYVALFNNDAVADKDWLQFLVAAADHDCRLGTVTGKILQKVSKNKIDSTGDFYSIWGLPFPRGRDEVDKGQYDAADQRLVFAGSGGASLYRVKMLEEIGLFDQAFFAYYEDIDLGFRAQLCNWHAAYEPRALVYHRLHATSSRLPNFSRYHSTKNALYVYHKNMPARLWWRYLPWFIGGMASMATNSIRRWQIAPLIKAYLVALWQTPTLIAQRIKIQRCRSVSTDDIDKLLYHDLPPVHQGFWRRLFGRKNVGHKKDAV